MSENLFSKLKSTINQNFQYIDVFKNPNKLPITEIYLERTWRELRKNTPKHFDIFNSSSKDLEDAYYEKKSEIIAALDKRWLPKAVLSKFEPYCFNQSAEENETFIPKNVQYLEGLDYLLNCNYHQFWCTMLFEPSATVALQSFLCEPILPFQIKYLQGEYLDVYLNIYNKVLLVYQKLVKFNVSETEYMPRLYGLAKLKEKKLLSLPIIITLQVLYEEYKEFVNEVADMYFGDATEVDYLLKEIETFVEENLVILEMITGHICGFDKSMAIIPIALEKRPPLFSLSWVYSAVNYLLSVLITSKVLFSIYNPSIEMALCKDFPYRLPFIYVSIYKELYEFLDEREEEQTENELFQKVIGEINLGRTEFIELFHLFVSNCLNQALQHIGDEIKQEHIGETYLNLLTCALEEDYFVCDYNATYSIAAQNEMFESCCNVDSIRTQFIVSCVNKLPRNKKLQELSKMKRQTIESAFRDFRLALPEMEETEPTASPSEERAEIDIEPKIRSIMDMFPHLGDGFILQCLESYNFNSSDVIDAILENNLPPHLSEVPFDSIRIPEEPEPPKPLLAYRGKKPQYDDALKLLNDKKDKQEIKNLVLEGLQYNCDNLYDDEYDDQLNDDFSIPVSDNPLDEELQTANPNRNRKSESEDEEDSDVEDEVVDGARNKLNFCEDPAVLRERREARYRSRNPTNVPQTKTKADVVGKPKGQGQSKETLLSRQKKTANKSGRANHNRKGGAQWKRTRGMVPS